MANKEIRDREVRTYENTNRSNAWVWTIVAVVAVLIVVAIIAMTNNNTLFYNSCSGIDTVGEIQTCCEAWAEDNNVFKPACVGTWQVGAADECSWVCATGTTGISFTDTDNDSDERLFDSGEDTNDSDFSGFSDTTDDNMTGTFDSAGNDTADGELAGRPTNSAITIALGPQGGPQGEGISNDSMGSTTDSSSSSGTTSSTSSGTTSSGGSSGSSGSSY
jgi:uncharacterized membrane protein YgcG